MPPGEGVQQTQNQFTAQPDSSIPWGCLLLPLGPRIAMPGWEPVVIPGSSPPPSSRPGIWPLGLLPAKYFSWPCPYLILTGP